jgi:type I restriction enzyme R subunit
MQAITRVNRVYGEKPGGLNVDLIGLADPLADALATYANATGETDKPVKELQDEVIPAMQSAFEQLRGFFHGYDYAAALEAEPASVLRVYLGAIGHVLDLKHNVGEETGWQRFRGMVKRLATAFALAVPREETREIAPHLAFFQRVAAMIRRRLSDEAGPATGADSRDSESRDIDAAVRQVIGSVVNASEVIDLFAAGGNGQEDAQARLDAAGERAGGPAAEGASPAGDVRLPAGPRGGRNPARAQAGRVVDGVCRVTQLMDASSEAELQHAAGVAPRC